MEVRFIDESDFVNKGNGFVLKDCPDWELDSTISLELTDLLDDIIISFLGGIYWSLWTATGVAIIIAHNNQSSQTSIFPVKRHRRAIQTKTFQCKQITAEIKTGKQQRC